MAEGDLDSDVGDPCPEPPLAIWGVHRLRAPAAWPAHCVRPVVNFYPSVSANLSHDGVCAMATGL